jgi:hypothetical protein
VPLRVFLSKGRGRSEAVATVRVVDVDTGDVKSERVLFEQTARADDPYLLVVRSGYDRATARDTELSESERTWLNLRHLSKPRLSGPTRPGANRTQEVAGSSPASSKENRHIASSPGSGPRRHRSR